MVVKKFQILRINNWAEGVQIKTKLAPTYKFKIADCAH